MVVLREEGERLRPRHDGDVPRQKKSVHVRLTAVEQGTHDGRHEFLRRQQEEVPAPLLLCREHRCCLGRRRRLKADGEEDHLFLRMLRRNRECVERRVDDAHIRPRCLCGGKARRRPRDFQHVAERRDDNILHLSIGNRRVDVAVGRHADGTARS